MLTFRGVIEITGKKKKTVNQPSAFEFNEMGLSY
jgi:hypothetical protein